MNMLQRVFRSSLGKKYLMAISGLILFGFVIGHMAGNLQIFLGREAINSYAEFLKSKPGLLWTARAVLLILVVVHIVTAIQLAIANRRARPERYGDYSVVGSSFAAQTILFSGLIIFAFVIYHLMHFTFGTIDQQFLTYTDRSGRHDVYR